MLRGFVAAVLAAVLASAPASAIVVSTYTGHVSSITKYDGSYGAFAVGDAVVLTFQYDPTINPSGRSGNSGYYAHDGAGANSPVVGTFFIGGKQVIVDPTLTGHFFESNGPLEQGGDAWSNLVASLQTVGSRKIITEVTAAMVGGDFLQNLDFRHDFTVTDAITHSFLSEFRIATIEDNQLVGAQDVNFYFDSLAVKNIGAIPEPATWALMLGGFVLIGAAMRRRRRTPISFA